MSNIEIIVTIVFNKESGESKVHFHSSACGSSQASELWIGVTSNRFQVIHQEAYYDEKLRNRRNSNNMLSSWSPHERITLVGTVWGVSPHIPNSNVSLGQTTIEALVYGT